MGVSELSRRNRASRTLRKFKAQENKAAWLSRKLRITSAKHAKELLGGSARRKIELDIQHSRNLASNVVKQRLRWSSIFRDLQRIKSAVAMLTKEVRKKREGYVQAKEAVRQKMKREREKHVWGEHLQ